MSDIRDQLKRLIEADRALIHANAYYPKGRLLENIVSAIMKDMERIERDQILKFMENTTKVPYSDKEFPGCLLPPWIRNRLFKDHMDGESGD